ncbi:MAG TPA: hypothetical protein VLO30_01960 [Chthoniobacterales bacterium]|nr:hypothetical protein [Chthoniobacterales bacterium]
MASSYDVPVLELEVYAAGVPDEQILELHIELGAISGLHYKVHRNHDIVYMELEAPTGDVSRDPLDLRKLGLEPEICGRNSSRTSAEDKDAVTGCLSSQRRECDW